jgi:hypothetical protein
MNCRNIAVVLLLVSGAVAAQTYLPPADAAAALQGVDFGSATAVGSRFSKRFNECDAANTCDGQGLGNRGCKGDKNRNAALLKLAGGVVFFEAKMAVDSDGSPLSRKGHGTDLPETSLRYDAPGKPSINADRVPYIVLPQGGFASELGVGKGDVAAVVRGGTREYAVVADFGPVCKIGEGSIQLHELLSHPVCRRRAPNGDCEAVRDVSIEKQVLYFVFPGTHQTLLPGMTPENVNQRIKDIGTAEWERLTR